jgi:hypothetical protein
VPGGLPQRLRLDSYTIIIIALLPSFLLIAAGATWFYERAEARRACSDATEYLADVSDMSASFQSAGTLSNARSWLTSMESLQPPLVARELHDSTVASVTYAISVTPDLDVSAPASVYEAVTPFQDNIDAGRDELIDECPDLALQIPDAFPMFFAKDGQ